jgi:hypothetical protein
VAEARHARVAAGALARQALMNHAGTGLLAPRPARDTSDLGRLPELIAASTGKLGSHGLWPSAAL